MDIKDVNIILASASPRRKELLSQVGLEFTVLPSGCDEIIRESTPDRIVMQLSSDKANDVALRILQSGSEYAAPKTPAVVIGADTVVVKDGRILGKPADRQEAFEMLSALRGGSHYVYTGVTLIYCARADTPAAPAAASAASDVSASSAAAFAVSPRTLTFSESTRVDVCDMSDEEIWEYIDTGESMDKAGAYGIQGRFSEYISGICGDYFNVVGLPVSRLARGLKELLKSE